jgi:hypothetical protein
MPSISALLRELDPTTIARKVALAHDTARNRYSCPSETVRDFDEFCDIIGDYYNYHFSTCIAHGGTLSRVDALGEAKKLLLQHYQRHADGVQAAFDDARYGTNSGLRRVLDVIADVLRAESIENHVRNAFDENVKPSSWDHKVEIIRQFFDALGPFLPPTLRKDQPESYATNYEDLIRGFAASMEEQWKRLRNPLTSP